MMRVFIAIGNDIDIKDESHRRYVVIIEPFKTIAGIVITFSFTIIIIFNHYYCYHHNRLEA